ncbi:MAG: type III secretion system export apparatus subunit SctT [Sphingomonas sp.]|uniref:type III secretion system export apparatus subunit SctT n=1 Tax=Sphingomonas sp. TaxID=28214 RepID=UPI001B0C415B|nr:type III secretion system export apparatus subunit SctT [Sphingomonas sp.]MBO9623403.1 type III secretion system export apparatus subunit SctT [Sphingomonas sp.]
MIEAAPHGVGIPLFAAMPWLDQLLTVGVAATRFAFAFVFVPIFSREVMPGTVRNSIIVTFGLVALAVQPDFAPGTLSAMDWVRMLFKEAAAGGIIGLFFGTVMWAMGAAGEIIDTKVGATIGQLIDPLSGTTTSLTGILLGRFAEVVFVTAGGLTLLVGTVMASYIVWPLGPGGIAVDMRAVQFFEGEFGRLFALAFIFAAPVLTVLYVIDAALGFLNRFAQSFNVFAMAMPIKAAAAVFVIILTLPLLGQAIVAELGTRAEIAGGVLQRTGQPR